MAQKVKITHVSDLSGEEITDSDAPSLSFGWNGVEYSIDLTAEEAQKFEKALKPYLHAATRVGRAKRGNPRKTGASGPSAAEIRAWARDNGFDVSDRGHVPSEVRKAYDSAS